MATAFHALSEMVSRAGAALRLCTLTNAYCHTHTYKHSEAKRVLCTRDIIILWYFTACLFSLLPPFFLPSFFLSFCLSPAVTRSNPESNGCRSLTLIKGGQLTKGPGVTFIRRLVKVYFSLALNTRGWVGGADRVRVPGIPGPRVLVVAVAGEGEA